MVGHDVGGVPTTTLEKLLTYKVILFIKVVFHLLITFFRVNGSFREHGLLIYGCGVLLRDVQVFLLGYLGFNIPWSVILHSSGFNLIPRSLFGCFIK